MIGVQLPLFLVSHSSFPFARQQSDRFSGSAKFLSGTDLYATSSMIVTPASSSSGKLLTSYYGSSMLWMSLAPVSLSFLSPFFFFLDVRSFFFLPFDPAASNTRIYSAFLAVGGHRSFFPVLIEVLCLQTYPVRFCEKPVFPQSDLGLAFAYTNPRRRRLFFPLPPYVVLVTGHPSPVSLAIKPYPTFPAG